MVVLSSSDLDSTRSASGFTQRRTASGTGFTSGRSSTGVTMTSSSSASRFSVPPTIGKVRITQSVDRDYTITSGSTPTAAPTNIWSSSTADSRYSRAASTSRSRGASPSGLASPQASSLYTPTASVLSSAASIQPSYRRRYSFSAASSSSTDRHGLDYHMVRAVDDELDRLKSSAPGSRWSRRNDVIYTADGPRPDTTVHHVRSRSTSRRRDFVGDDVVGENGYGELIADSDDTDDVISRRVRTALSGSKRSRSRARSMTRIETAATASAAAKSQINQLRGSSGGSGAASGSIGAGSQHSSIYSRRASIGGFRASSVTRSPADVYYANPTGTGSQTSYSTGRRGVRFEDVGDTSGWDLTSFVLNPGEKFVPTDVSVSVLPSGKKAVTYTRFAQDGHGDQSAANVEIDRVIQRTKRMQDTMHTLENFVKRNRSLFPEDIIIYQHIVFYLLDPSELKRLGMNPNQEVYGVKIRERLVAPYGTDVASILKRYYSRHTEVEIEYLEREDIRRRLRQEMGEADEEEESRKRRRYRTDIEETTETEIETRRNRLRNKAPSVEGRPPPVDRKLIVDDDQLIQERTRIIDESGPQFTSRLQPKRVRTGNTIRLTCNVTGNPAPTVTWYRGNQEIVGNGRFSINNTFGLCTLKIIDTRLEDTGVYTARAVNRIGEMSTSAELYVDANEDLEVSREEATRKPWFLIDAQNTWAEVGQRAVIEAQATGRPLPKFRWQKDNVDVQLDLRVRSVSDELGNIKLVIRDVKPTDAGVYFCIAENSEGRAKSAATLRVVNADDTSIGRRTPNWEVDITTENWIRQLAANHDEQASKEPPRGRKPTFVEVPPTYIDVNEGDPLTLRCTVDGDPRPVVTWYKGARELTYSERHRVLAETETQYMMQCKWTLQTDPGEYTIVASNACGLAAFTLFVNVLPRVPQEIDFPTDKRKLASRDYELVKKMKQGKMAPVFIRKLPLEKTIKVGQTLVIRCSIEEAKMREYLADVDIIVKDKMDDDADSSYTRRTRPTTIQPDFIFTAADDVTNGMTSQNKEVPQLDNNDVSVTVLKNVVHVTDNKNVDVTPSSPPHTAPPEVEPPSDLQHPVAAPPESTNKMASEPTATEQDAFVTDVEQHDVTEAVKQVAADEKVKESVGDVGAGQPTEEKAVEAEHIEQQQAPVSIPEVQIIPPDNDDVEEDIDAEDEASEVPAIVVTSAVESSSVDEAVPDNQQEPSSVVQAEVVNDAVSKNTESVSASDISVTDTASASSVLATAAATNEPENTASSAATEQVSEQPTEPVAEAEVDWESDTEELPEIEAAAEDIPSTTIAVEAETALVVDAGDSAAGVVETPPLSAPATSENLENARLEEVENTDAVEAEEDEPEPAEAQREPETSDIKEVAGARLTDGDTSTREEIPVESPSEQSSDIQNQTAVVSAADDDDAAEVSSAAAAADPSETVVAEKKLKTEKTKKKSSGKSKTKSKKKEVEAELEVEAEVETEATGSEQAEVELLNDEDAAQ